MEAKDQELIRKIAELAYDNVPVPDWNIFIMECKMIASFASLIAFYYHDKQDTPIYFNPNSSNSSSKSITILFKELREELYSMNERKGTWYTAVLEISKAGKFKIRYDYDNKPAFKYSPENEEYVQDFLKYPRDREYIPTWLAEILKEHKIAF